MIGFPGLLLSFMLLYLDLYEFYSLFFLFLF